MYIYEYYIIIYDKFLDYQIKLENYNLEKKVKNSSQVFNNNDSIKQTNNKSNDANNPNDDTNTNTNTNNDTNNDTNTNTNLLTNHILNNNPLNNLPNEIRTKKNISESGNWIKKIYTKLIFMYHPDKQINSDDQIFSKIKNDYDKNDYSSLLYYFIKDRDHPYLSRLFNETIQNKKFIDSLLNLSNYMDYKINLILGNTDFINYMQKHTLVN